MTLYQKVGRRYIPVSESVEWDSFQPGQYLLTVCERWKSAKKLDWSWYSQRIVLDYLNALAVLQAVEPELLKFVSDAMQKRPTQTPITKKQADAWRAFSEAMGNDMAIHVPSVGEVVDALYEAVLEAAKKGGK